MGKRGRIKGGKRGRVIMGKRWRIKVGKNREGHGWGKGGGSRVGRRGKVSVEKGVVKGETGEEGQG